MWVFGQDRKSVFDVRGMYQEEYKGKYKIVGIVGDNPENDVVLGVYSSEWRVLKVLEAFFLHTRMSDKGFIMVKDEDLKNDTREER
jgi:hypothetical protein